MAAKISIFQKTDDPKEGWKDNDFIKANLSLLMHTLPLYVHIFQYLYDMQWCLSCCHHKTIWEKLFALFGSYKLNKTYTCLD